MALQGSLGQLGLADVLQTALAGQAGGDLILVKGAERAVLHVAQDGLHLLEPDVLDPEDVLTAFQERGVVSREALALAAGRSGLKGLGLLDQLVAQGALPESELLDVVAGAAEDTILDLLTWSEGTFRFEENTELPPRPNLVGRVSVDRSSVLLRAAQRIDERSAIAQAVGIHARLFVTTGAPPPPVEDPEDPLGRVAAALDGRATVDEIALRLGISRFAALKAAAALVEAQAARPARPEELAVAAQARQSTKQFRTARVLVLQWMEADAADPAPLRVLATLGERRERPPEVVAALTMLGHRLLAAGDPGEAAGAFQDALERHPGDEPALEGLRAAAAAKQDDGLWCGATLRLARVALDGDDPVRSAALAGEVLESHPGDMGALMVRARAQTAAKDREGVTQTSEAVLQAVGKKATRRLELETLQFCRDAIALLAPERSDLLRGLRALTERRAGSRRRVALVAALLAIAGGAGFVWWPVGAGGLLGKAQDSIQAGDRSQALDLLAQVLERFPDSEEAGEAARLQAQLQPPAPTARAATARKAPEALALPPLVPALAALPDPQALAQVALHVTAMTGAKTGAAVAALPDVATRALSSAVARFALELRARQDALARTGESPARWKGRTAQLREAIEAAEKARDTAPVEAWKATLPALSVLAASAKAPPLQREISGLQPALEAYARSAAVHEGDLLECRRLLASMEIDDLHTACREQAPRLLVAGRLGEVEQIYAALAGRLEALRAAPDMAPVLESASRQGLPDFLRERQALVKSIRSSLAAAKAAEEAGDLEAAATAYGEVTKRHYTVRFDDLIQVPLRVQASPAGATVKLNGAPAGSAPLTLHYGWGVPATVSVEAPGFEPFVRVLEAREGTPVTSLEARLKPRIVWSAPLGGAVEARALPVGDDVLVCDRAGHVSLFAGSDGRLRWSRRLSNVEGTRGRPGYDGHSILVVCVDGSVVLLDARDGSVQREEQGPRPFGDVAAVDGTAAVATIARSVVGYVEGRPGWTATLPGAAVTSLVAGHGALWLCAEPGVLVRIDPASGAVRTFPLPAPVSAATSLAASDTGWLVCLADGRLVSLTAEGLTRWSAPNLGDLGSAAAQAGTVVAVSDRRGRVTLLDAATGAPRGSTAMSREPVGGIATSGSELVATTGDGRLWVFDPASKVVRVDAPLAKAALLMPAALAGGGWAVVSRDGLLLRVPAFASGSPVPDAAATTLVEVAPGAPAR